MNINFRKILYILFISAVIGFTYNFLSPSGIPLIKEEIKLGELAEPPQNSGELDYTKIKAIKIDQAYKLYEDGAMFVDARDMWEFADGHIKGSINFPEIDFAPDPVDELVKVIEHHRKENKVNLKSASIIVAGGYGMQSKENFAMIHELADLLGGEVAGTRAAVDAGFISQ